MSRYFDEIIHGVKSTFEGMSIAIASMFVMPITVQYPDVDIRSNEALRETGYKGPLRGMPENYRGILDVTMDICISCKLCMKACPIDCIIIDDVKTDKHKVMGTSGKESVKTKRPIIFNIDIGKCMFCGLCVDPCPTGAIYHTNEFVSNQPNLAKLVYKFVSEEEKTEAIKRGEEILVEDAAAKKAKKEAAAAKEAATEKTEEAK